MAELNSRIQATAAQPSPAVKALPPPSKTLSGVARPAATLSSAQNSAPLHSTCELPRPATLVLSNGVLQLQFHPGDEMCQHTVKYTPSCDAAVGVQLVKLSGTTSVGL